MGYFSPWMQAGKTTLARQAMEGGRSRSHYASADEPTLQDRALGRLTVVDRIHISEFGK